MPKKNRLEIRLDDIDLVCLKKMARKSGLSMSEYLRRLLVKDCEEWKFLLK